MVAGGGDLRDGPRRARAGPHPGPARPRVAPGRLPRRPADARIALARSRGCAWRGCTSTHVPVLPELVLGELPAGTHVLDDDPRPRRGRALCDAALRSRPTRLDRADRLARRSGPGSAATLADEGHSSEAIDRIRTPIGLPEIGRQGTGDHRRQRRGCAAARPRAGPRHGRRTRPRGTPMTLFRGNLPRHPGRPVHRRGPAGRRRRGTARRDGVIVERGDFADVQARAPGRGRRRPERRRGAARASSTPTSTSRRSAPSAGWACRCWTGWSAARCPRRRGCRTSRTPPPWPRSSSAGSSDAGTTTALVFGVALRRRGRRAVQRGRAGSACGSRAVWSSATGCCGTTCSRHAAARLRRGIAPRRAVARRRPQPVRRHPSVLALVRRRPARLVRGTPPRRPRVLVHLAHQRERPAEIDGGRRNCSAVSTTSTRTTGTASSAAAACWPTTCTRPTTSWRSLAARGASSRPLPDQQRRSGQRTVPAPTPPSARGSGRARVRRRRRHRLLAAQGRPAGLLRPADARRRGIAVDRRAPAPPATAAGRDGARTATRSVT